MKHISTKLTLLTALALVVCMLFNVASACTTLYVGSALTADGSTLFGRSEDYSNSQNKLFYVSEAGKHVAGELYEGCYGFTWTFTHDSYSYTAFSDDNGAGVDGVCPDCDDDHPHTPYEAAGTNEKGLTVTATETIYGCEATEDVDPFEDLGIEEAEIVTVLLGEAASAQEALAVLTGIYDDAGANGGSGIIIADATEAWYIENVTGHQYIAVKLSDSMIFMQPNMVIIGEIDLDDTDNVVASAGLIETAKTAGTFVGDEENNIINYVASYVGETTANARMQSGLSYLTGKDIEDEATYDPSVYLITNLTDGEIVTMHTGIVPAVDKFTIEDAQGFYHISNIGYVRNLENHIFQISDDTATGTVEWVCMNDSALGIYVPYLPMLTTYVHDSYMVSTPTAEFVEAEPEGGVYYTTSTTRRVDGQRVTVEGFRVLPEEWGTSMYWSFDALSNLTMYGNLSDEQVANVYEAVYAAQAYVNATFADAKDSLTTAELASDFSANAAEFALTFAVTTVNDLID